MQHKNNKNKNMYNNQKATRIKPTNTSIYKLGYPTKFELPS